MNELSDKVILVDCDGVILDWEFAFDRWMERHGYVQKERSQYDMHIKYGMEKGEMKRMIRMFNESASIRKLPPLRDAIHYVRKLHTEHGYIFRAISSLSNDEYAQHLRTKNLRELFGDTAFDRYTYLDCGADKDEALAPYEGSGCIWVEDKIQNAEVGHQLGLETFLMVHPHNQDYSGPVTKVGNWKELYEKIIGY